ncbi:hypothetical protein F511_44840 [Dorcoceras hygrometricum]|uniref:Uncharacterized protein n=1 Tax=Dorcoceras hygrometricum TaxID=472368 RepID=A0A2Z7AXE4_9LAMI|nr:hypothetical protein F511_44840 [Dorcoceras hygrometricum]
MVTKADHQKLRRLAGDEARHLARRGAIRSASSGAIASGSVAILAASARRARGQCASSARIGARCGAAACGGRRAVKFLVLRSIPNLKFNKLDTIMANHIDQIRETMALIPLLGIRIRPPVRQRKNNEQRTGRRSIRKIINILRHSYDV